MVQLRSTWFAPHHLLQSVLNGLNRKADAGWLLSQAVHAGLSGIVHNWAHFCPSLDPPALSAWLTSGSVLVVTSCLPCKAPPGLGGKSVTSGLAERGPRAGAGSKGQQARGTAHALTAQPTHLALPKTLGKRGQLEAVPSPSTPC